MAEADEAWCVLLRQKRREGLCGKGVRAVRHITPAAPPISGAEDEIAFAAVDTSRDFSSSARDSAGLMAGLSQDALNSEGDDLDRDLPAPPGLAELEESVDVPYTPEIFDTAASSSSSVGNGEAHSSASSGGSGNGSSQGNICTIHLHSFSFCLQSVPS